jgi:electron transport complex protein RnfA
MNIFMIFVSAAIINNYVLTMFLGICSFVGVSQRMSSAVGMGLSVIFVMTITAPVTWILYHLMLKPYDLVILQNVAFILIIASLVQFVEMFIKKTSRPLYDTLGIYLPLITTNCAILGVALFSIIKDYSFIESIVYGIGGGVGYMLALLIMTGIREELDLAPIPVPFRGAGITMIVSGSLALAFMGFAGIFS